MKVFKYKSVDAMLKSIVRQVIKLGANKCVVSSVDDPVKLLSGFVVNTRYYHFISFRSLINENFWLSNWFSRINDRKKLAKILQSGRLPRNSGKK